MPAMGENCGSPGAPGSAWEQMAMTDFDGLVDEFPAATGPADVLRELHDRLAESGSLSSARPSGRSWAGRP